MENCIFCKIVRGEIPSRKVFDDELVFAFHDIHPLAPVHFMLIPKEHVTSMAELAELIVLDHLRGQLSAKAAATLRHVAAEGQLPGWDIEYQQAGALVAIEVKGATGKEFPAVEITANEWEAAERLRERYWLYLVTDCLSTHPSVTPVHDPYGLHMNGSLQASPLVWRLERSA